VLKSLVVSNTHKQMKQVNHKSLTNNKLSKYCNYDGLYLNFVVLQSLFCSRAKAFFKFNYLITHAHSNEIIDPYRLENLV